jgi:hypothetical protein
VLCSLNHAAVGTAAEMSARPQQRQAGSRTTLYLWPGTRDGSVARRVGSVRRIGIVRCCLLRSAVNSQDHEGHCAFCCEIVPAIFARSFYLVIFEMICPVATVTQSDISGMTSFK